MCNSFCKPLNLVRVATPRVSSSHASRWTLKRRTSSMSSVRKFISGGEAAVQLQDEITVLTEEERQEILKSADCTNEISPEETLAMKANLVLPWKKMRIMHR